jgi:hypothetical protein
MDIKEYETSIRDEINSAVAKIISAQTSLNISAKSRAGAEISEYLAQEFQKRASGNKLAQPEAAPAGATKHPWDARVFFVTPGGGKEEVWIDFKAIKTSSADSNPDIGTPDKVIKFIKEGNFYVLFVFAYYQETPTGLDFVKHNGQYTKSYFLKDVSPTVRRNAKNQLQVNISAEPLYRSRTDFVELLFAKLRESYHREIALANARLSKLDTNLRETKCSNEKSEDAIIKSIAQDQG